MGSITISSVYKQNRFIFDGGINSSDFDNSFPSILKVKYIADAAQNQTSADSNQESDVKAMGENRFSETMTFDRLYDENSNESTRPYVEPVDRSCKQFDANFIFRYSLLLCLLNAPPFSSDQADFITLFETEGLVVSQTAESFKKTYSASKAVYFYSKEPFLYAHLNSALRTSNVSQLVLFRFFIQDMFNQLRELMTQQTEDHILTVYRGQQSSAFEVADLSTAYHQSSPFVINSFFSTSKKRDCAIKFLLTKDLALFDTDRKPILFKINIQKQDASRQFPFADISKFSATPEEAEVLFVPGQMFTINNFNIIHEHELNIFCFEMTLSGEFDKNATAVYDKFKNIWNTQTNDPFLYLGQLMITNKRFDEAKELYTRLLLEDIDKEKRAACYQGLFVVAMDQKDTDEGMIMYREMIQAQLGGENLSTDSEIEVSQTDYEKITTSFNEMMSVNSQLSLDRPLDELLTYSQSDQDRNDRAQMTNQVYTIATVLMKSGTYSLAIQFLQTTLSTATVPGVAPLHPLLKAQYYMQLGHCYHELKLYDKAVANYKLTLEQNIHLPLHEYIDTLVGFGMALEGTNNYNEALARYIQAVEIYQNNPATEGLEGRTDIEEAIQRVLARILLMNENYETATSSS